jgi:glucokinase
MSPAEPAAAPEPGDQGPGPVLAIDIGGTKFEAAIVSAEGEILERRQVPTLTGADADALFDHLLALVAEVKAASEAHGGSMPAVCGVGSGGPMLPDGETVSPLNIAAWRGFPLRDRLAAALALPTSVDNDAKALALAEGWRGAARSSRNFIAMVVSTGIGGGIVLDGRLLDGAQGNAGHIGHMTVEPDGRACRCGSFGCLEAEASGTAIAEITGRPAAEADAAMVERCGLLVGRAVANVATLLDLRLAVIAGSVALGYGAPFFAAAQAEIDRRARLEFARGCEIRPAGLGADGPLVGAAAVGLRRLGVAVGPT